MKRVVRFNSRYKEYLDYLDKHIGGVITCWEDIMRPALEASEDEEILSRVNLDEIGLQVYNHDRSKYDDEEFSAYCNHWYPQDGSEVEHKSDKPQDDVAYNYAWSHHQHNNPHHSQYWLMVTDDGNIDALDIPLNYIMEMICDWSSFHINNPEEQKASEWYKEHEDSFIMSDNTREWIGRIFEICEEL